MDGTAAATRRAFLALALRRARPGTGSSDPFLQRRTAMRTWPDLSAVLGPIPWAVVGAVATRAYMPERATEDLDVLVTLHNASEVRQRLRNAGYRPLQPLAIGGSAWASPDGTPVDVVESADPWVTEALRATVRDPQGLPVLSLPYLVLMKVQSGRTQDLADSARMLGLAPDADRDATRELFRRWLPDALEDLESLITLGKLEMGQ